MQHVSVSVCRLLAPVLALAALAPADLAAQSSNAERVLVLPPEPVDGVDSALAVEIGNELRDRMRGKFRFDFLIIPTATICEALEASGFSCGAVPEANAGALARFLQASGYVLGWLRPAGDTLVYSLRMVDRGRSGLSGWQEIRVPRTERPDRIARTVADALEDHVDAAERARQCDERRGQSDFRGARQRADQAFEGIPNHPSAAMCMALVSEATQAPLDTIVQFLRRATAGDSMNSRAWEMLGRRLQEGGDSLQALAAFRNQLRAEPGNLRLRLGVAAGMMQQGAYEQAVALLDEALANNPADLQVLGLKERACLDGELWDCALDALDAEYEVDSSLIGDSIFYAKAFGAAQSAPDTAAMLRWSEVGVTHLPNSMDMWRARANALRTAGQQPEALDAYRRVIALDSMQIGSALAAAQILLDTATLVIDSTQPLDTARIFWADSLLQLVARQSEDPATRMNVAVMYLSPGIRLVSQRMRFPVAARFLRRAIENDVQNRITVTANFYLGLAYFFQIFEMDQRVRETESCEMVDELVELVRRTREALEAGAGAAPELVNNLLQNVQQVESQLPNYKPAFECPGT